MTTDEKLIDMIVDAYRDEGLRVPLAAVTRRRSWRLAPVGVFATAVAVLAALLVWPGGHRPRPPTYVGPVTVMVDIFSGRENPEVELSPGVADQSYRDLDARTADLSSVMSYAVGGLGFRGFVLTPRDRSFPVVRVTETDVWVEHADSVERLTDGRYYALIRDDISGRLPAEIVELLP